MANNKEGVPKEFKISSGPVPGTGSPAGEGLPDMPKDCGYERIPEFEYPPKGLPAGPTGKD